MNQVNDIAKATGEVAKLGGLIGRGVFGLEAKAIIKNAKAQALALEIKTDAMINNAEKIESYKKRLIATAIAEEENLESISLVAAKNLPPETQSVEVEAGWALKYTKAACDISDAELQEIWGKLLAGEIIQKGRYSLKTIEILKSMSSEDARVFERVCPYVVGDMLVCCGPDQKPLEIPQIHEKDIRLLQWHGLIENVSTGLQRTVGMSYDQQPNTTNLFSYNGLNIGIETSQSGKIIFYGYVLSKAGMELIKVITNKPDYNYLNQLALSYSKAGKHKFSIVDEIENNMVKKSRALPFPESEKT